MRLGTLHDMSKKEINNKLLLGRNEWCSLSKLCIPAIKAKIDTGAMTSAIHAFNIRLSPSGNVLFDVHPLQGNDNLVIHCKSPFLGTKKIMSSNGHKETRFVVKTTLILGRLKFEIGLTLSNRDPLKFRLLLGREALSSRFLIDPSIACVQNNFSKTMLSTIYSI